MRKLIILTCFIMVFGLTGCGVSNSSDISFDAEIIKYDIDSRTGLCFAITASKKGIISQTSGLGMAHVPCTDKVLQLIDPEKINKSNIYKK